MLIRVDGLDTFYQTQGEGDAVVLLHGWGTSSQSLDPVAAWLLPAFRVVSVDLPGFGWSQAPPAAWGTAEYAAHVRQLLTVLGIERAALLGHSFGGRVALQLASRHPELVARLVLVASAGVRPPRGPRYYLRVGTTKALRLMLSLPGLRGVGARRLERWRATAGSRDYRAAGRMRPTLVKVVNEDLRPILPAVQAPTLILWGDQDQEVPRSAMDVMTASIPGARLTVFPGAGHFPFQDAPEAFCQALAEFLRPGARAGATKGWDR